MCEAENETVMTRLVEAVNARLPGRGYRVVHADTVDQRGIDVAFVYDPARFTASADQRFQHVVMRRTATREIFQINFRTAAGRTLAVFGNHWPSRSGGQAESAGYRAIAGETLAYFHQRVWEACLATMIGHPVDDRARDDSAPVGEEEDDEAGDHADREPKLSARRSSASLRTAAATWSPSTRPS